jgi:hypothetical protein
MERARKNPGHLRLHHRSGIPADEERLLEVEVSLHSMKYPITDLPVVPKAN